MTDRPDTGKIDYDRLATYLRVLGLPSRLQLLRQLQVPLAVGEIVLQPSRQDRALSPSRSLTRQAVEDHLDTLEELGLVHARASQREGRSATEYVVSHARLFLIIEELKRLTLIRSLESQATAGPASSDRTTASLPLPTGPSLVVVSGPLEGRGFPLEGKGPWTIGRDKGADISIPYDPFLSKANTLVTKTGRALEARTIAGSRNGTSVNWRHLEADESQRLKTGDIIGVGRSLLVVWGD